MYFSKFRWLDGYLTFTARRAATQSYCKVITDQKNLVSVSERPNSTSPLLKGPHWAQVLQEGRTLATPFSLPLCMS